MLETIKVLLEELDTDKKHMPPTTLYNRGWLLRLVLYLFSKHHITGHSLTFIPGAEWYSEGQLASTFLPVYQGDELAESYTHADGVTGHIAVGKAGRGDIFLIEPFEQFIVLEAKLFDPLAGGIKRAPEFDQVARNVACMAEVVKRSGCSVEGFRSLGFYVLAPECQINSEVTFKKYIQKESVQQKVRQRVEAYRGRSDYEDKRKWFDQYFEPLIDKIDVSLISWEIIIDSISTYDREMGEKLLEFYNSCLKYNKPG